MVQLIATLLILSTALTSISSFTLQPLSTSHSISSSSSASYIKSPSTKLNFQQSPINSRTTTLKAWWNPFSYKTKLLSSSVNDIAKTTLVSEASGGNAGEEYFRKYMIKSQESIALKNAELKKMTHEIMLMRTAMSQPSSDPASNANSNPNALVLSSTGENAMELEVKLNAYKGFMEKYIIDTLIDRQKAVKLSEGKIIKFYEDKFKLLGSGGAAPVYGDAEVDMLSKLNEKQAVEEERILTNYERRNIYITSALEAKQSRWPANEIKRVSSYVSGTKALPPLAASGGNVNGNGGAAKQTLNGKRAVGSKVMNFGALMVNN